MGRKLRRVLIANRGEIAVRIIRACHQMGLEAIAVYSEPDASSLHVSLADDAKALGGKSPVESYLNSQKILAAAREAKADAIHPGYGFLSENDDFATMVQSEGLLFVGPRASTIALMGDKSAAKNIMRKAGVPVVPGYDGADQSDERLLREAHGIGVPLLIKAAHGGGGKGMRLVEDLAFFQESVAAARRESLAAFGSESLLLEKYLKPVRHIEVQILGDQFGRCLHLLERECSIQRRHQKIIEECPSSFVNEELRGRLTSAALLAAEAVSYCNAGTVEFVVEESGAFYFLEMNTRLQVEHPVTEWVTGIDLVHQQLKIAAGKPLEIQQSAIRPRGHAIEARVYAEDPSRLFAPSVGRILAVQEPIGPGIRVDSLLFSGWDVSPYYDAMLAKVTAFAWNRREAIEKLDWALSHTLICGITTNIPYLRTVLAQSAFHAGETTTDFLENHLSDWQPEPPPLEVALIAASKEMSEKFKSHSVSGDQHQEANRTLWGEILDFRMGEKR